MTDKFKQECKNMAYKNRLGKIELDNETISNSDYLSSIEITDSCISNGTILGNTNSKSIKVNTLCNYDLADKQINPFIGVKYDDSSEEYIKIGKYTITSETNDKTSKNGEYIGVDSLNKLDEVYKCSIENLKDSTVLDFYKDVCQQIGLKPKRLEFINQDLPVNGNPFTNNETCRVVLQNIAQVFCSFVDIDWETEEIDLIWFDDEYSETITKRDYSTLEKNQVYGPINSLSIKDSQIDGENVVIEQNGKDISSLKIDGKSEQTATNGTNLIGLDNNQYKVDLKIGDKICVTNNGTTQLNLNLYTNYGDTARNDYFTIYANSKRIVSVLKDAKAIAWGGTIEGLVWVNKGEEQLPYEEYTGGQPSPSPDYPQEIKSVEGIENLFDYEDESNYVETTNSSIEKINNGIRVTNKIAGTYKFARYKIENNIVKTMLGKTYTFSCDFAASGSNNGLVAIYWSNSNNSTFSNISSLNISGNYITFTLPSEIPTGAEYISLLFYSNRNSSTIAVGDYVDYTNIQMTEGSITYDYVPYGHWLNVKNTGKNFLNLPDGTYTNNGITAVIKDGIITLNGTATATSFITINNVFNYTFKANQKYTISFNNKTLISDTNARFRFSKNGGFDVVKDFYFNNINSSQTFYFTKDTEVEWIQIRTGVNITYDNFIIKPQLEKGSTATEYEPYQEQSTLIDMNKPNLFDKYLDTIEIGNSWNNSKNTKRATIVIPYEGNKPYTIKCSKMEGYQYVSIIETADRTSFYYTTNDTQPFSRTVVSNANTKYICLQLTTTNDFTIDMLDNLELKIYEGYTDYYELCSIGDTKDELNIDKDGNVSITQNIGEVVLDGSENWAKNGNETVYYCTSNILGNIKQQLNNDTAPYLISTHFRTVAPSQMWTNPTNDLTITSFISKNNEPRIRYNAISTVDNFKTWLSTHPVTVKYILDKPQTISLGKITPLKLLEGTNNITNNDELSPSMEIVTDYIGNTEEYTGSYINIDKPIYELNEISIEDNYFLNTEELRRKAIDSIWNRIKNFSYIDCKITSYTGKPYLKRGNKIKVQDDDETYFDTYVLSHNFTYDGTFKSIIESPALTKTQTVMKNNKSLTSYFRKVERSVDKVNGKIVDVIDQVDTVRDDLNNNYYTIQKTNELIQTSGEGITNTFSEAGGNNVFRNTGLWFENQNGNWEYWTGNAKKTTNDKATLNNSILLQSGIFSQEQDVPNGNYSVSFYYKLLNELATATVTINEQTYKLTSTDYKQFYTGEQDSDGNYIVYPIEVSSNHIKISFSTDIDNSVEIYDLMANKGTVKLAYSQNENEITTDTVNISKGITITSSTTDTKFKADSDGIRILNKNNNEKTTEFTDKGMITKEAIVEEEATIVKVLIQDINEQTWFTRL